MGVISAASARHPRPSNLMMGIPARLHKAVRDAVLCRNGRPGPQYGVSKDAAAKESAPLNLSIASGD
jgi:hypothetical protein